MNVELGGLSGGWIAVLAVVIAVEVALLVWALVRWSRTPDGDFSLPKPLWLVIILVASIVGPLAFLVAGRAPGPVADPLLTEAPDAGGPRGHAVSPQQRALDLLYPQPPEQT